LLCLGDMNFTGAQFMGELARHGYDPGFPFAEVRQELAQAAVRVANLEGPLTFAEWSDASATKPWRFRQLPLFARAIREAGIDIVLLGNNHIYDAGDAGLRDTERVLAENALRWAPPPGEGPLQVTAQGRRLYLWNADLSSPPGSHPWATGVQSLAEVIAAFETEHREEHLAIAFIHLHDAAGQTAVTRALRSAGVDWVIFGGSHDAGRLEREQSGGVHTGLGDFVFGCECSTGTTARAWTLRESAGSVVGEERVLHAGRAPRGFVAEFAK